MSYLIRDGLGTYYFRRVIPVDLRPFMPAPWTGKANWKRSLGTKQPAAAKKAGSCLLRDCMTDFEAAERAKQGEVPKRLLRPSLMPSADEIAADVLAELLAADAAERSGGDPRKQHQTREERGRWRELASVAFDRRGIPEDYHHAMGEGIELLLGDFRRALSRSDTSIVDVECCEYLRGKNIPIDPDSDGYHEAGLAVLQAHVKAYTLMLERQRGEIVAIPALSATRGPKLSEALASWTKGGGAKGSRKPSPKTLLEAGHAVRRFTEWHGDVRLGDITREMVREFRDALARAPTRLAGDLRQLPLRELLKQDLKGFPPVQAVTVNKSLNILAAIVSHEEAAGRLDAVAGYRNPFGRGAKLIVDGREGEGRQPFDKADLGRLFATGVFTAGERPVGGCKEAAFWLPLLALLSGARQAELAQLRVADVAQDEETGVWYLDIGTAGGRKIKTVSSRRKVPMHPELERIGLLRYRQSLLDAGEGPESPLWPGLLAGREVQPAGAWSKWFTRHLREKAGIEDRAKVFHSFRHSFKRMARDARLGEEVHDALTGHSGGGGIGRGYGSGFGLKTLAEEMARIEAPEAVQGLKWMLVGKGR
ncbi:hypothetical protein ASF60_22210 [Methylobacterium sp. Leaf113]|uniref:site-specific integrase n=1 Tax=Methylobacterium sp. Leaf113 TaxID=1736259 RepID=UPI0006F1D7EA|nr:site-specific integrase [Methylobacterium sp. Leaf113]KQP81772.1 hypothetical protein ASF60_22210 [Methylobacterium sp. Leaf113]